MKKTIKRIKKGFFYSEEYGSHPGWGLLFLVTIAGLVVGGLKGMGLMFIAYFPLFLVGCWNRGDCK